MVLRRRGHTVDQLQLAASWWGSKRGYSLHDAADTLDATVMSLDPRSPELPDYFTTLLHGERWLIAQVFCSALQTHHYAHHPPPNPGPHGPLPTGPPGLLHAIVLVEAQHGGRFAFLDPHHHATRQPFVMSRAALVSAIQGSVVVCPI